MKINSILLASLLLPAWAGAQTLSIDEPSAPTGALIEQTTGNTFTRAFHNHSTAGKATRGQTFLMPDTGNGSTDYSITGITLRKNATQTFAVGDTLELWIFPWIPDNDGNDATNWTQTGTNGFQDGDPLSGTGMTPLLVDTFDLNGLTFTNNLYFTIDLSASPLTFTENKVYAFMLAYVDGDGTGGNNDYFEIKEANSSVYADGSEPRVQGVGAASANNLTTTRDLTFWIQGSEIITGIVPPTITASEDFITTGSSVDLDITFDTTADTATLTTPGGPVDLLTIDASDAIPGDGMVVYSDSPTSTFTYDVTLTKSGETDESAQAKVLVADPSTEAPDNAFSTALKADSPLFYYRFEEAADTGFLLDSSGNGHHTADIVGTLVQGTGPGGMQKAGDLTNVGIRVPATSDMGASFTATAVVTVDNYQAAIQHIYSITDGTGTGRSVFYPANGQLRTFINGATLTNPGGTVPGNETTCLLHFIYDTDPDANPVTDDQEVRFYINGVLQGGAGVLSGSVPSNVGNWVLGANKLRTTQFLKGWLDETAVFESVLTDGQIAAHATAFFAAADPLLGYVADTVAVSPGGSVTLTWKISDLATAVTINGASQTLSGGGIYTTVFNPLVTTTYTLEVSGPGGPFTRMIEVTVLAPPKITAISADGSTPPMITLDAVGPPNTTYNVKASSILDDGFPNTAGTLTTNGAGVGTTTFSGLGTAEYYRLESQ